MKLLQVDLAGKSVLMGVTFFFSFTFFSLFWLRLKLWLQPSLDMVGLASCSQELHTFMRQQRVCIFTRQNVAHFQFLKIRWSIDFIYGRSKLSIDRVQGSEIVKYSVEKREGNMARADRIKEYIGLNVCQQRNPFIFDEQFSEEKSMGFDINSLFRCSWTRYAEELEKLLLVSFFFYCVWQPNPILKQIKFYERGQHCSFYTLLM